MSNKILFVVEGEKAEKEVFFSLQKHLIPETEAVLTAFCGEVYSFYHCLINDEGELDEDVDIFPLLRKRECNKELLRDIKRKNISEIFLFFDFDGHAPAAKNEKLLNLLNYFNEQTERGKLFISYPMVEALQHLKNETSFQHLTVAARENIKYKALVNQEGDSNLKKLSDLTLEDWSRVTNANLKKANFIMTGSYSISDVHYEQFELFQQQDQKYIQPFQTVAVLSAFPLFLVDFFGDVQTLRKRLNTQ